MNCPDCNSQAEKTDTIVIDSYNKVVIYYFPCGAKYEQQITKGLDKPVKVFNCQIIRPF